MSMQGDMVLLGANDLSATGCIAERPHVVPPQSFQVVGERCSGTNYVSALIQANLKIQNTRLLGWKHGFPMAVGIPRTHLVVVVVRNALDWSRSMFHKPWHSTKDLRRLPFGEFLRSEWRAEIDKARHFKLDEDDPRVGTVLQYDLHPVTGRPFANIIDMRNVKLAAQLGYLERDVNVVIVRHEAVSAMPQRFVEGISKVFAVDARGEFQNPDKHFGFPKFRRDPSLVSPPKGLDANDRAFIIDQLDLEQEGRLGYSYSAT